MNLLPQLIIVDLHLRGTEGHLKSREQATREHAARNDTSEKLSLPAPPTLCTAPRITVAPPWGAYLTIPDRLRVGQTTE